MSTKLTLTIDQSVIEKAKKYAAESGRSLSDIVETYLRAITVEGAKDGSKLSPVVKSLKGAFKAPEDFDYKQELAKALRDKYGKEHEKGTD